MRGGLLGGTLLLVAAVELAAAWYGADPAAVDLRAIFAPPSLHHPLGADALGRDLLARLAEGLRLSLSVALLVVAISAAVGISLGIFSARMGGWVDALLMRITDIVLSFPGMLLAIALAAMLGPGIGNLVLALTVVGWTGFARLARAQTLSLQGMPFIEAAIGLGVGPWRLARHHLLPVIAAPLLVEASFGIASVMIGEAGLSFLGIGVQPPAASLGAMIRDGARVMLVAPALVFWPGMLLFMLVLAANLLGDGLRDRLARRGR
ncbi:MAG: ABC transporter permease [Zetaproteobacteria bacterium]|nr:MAG: ABC transporter permease [Zetaproteobacteria bacterium]